MQIDFIHRRQSSTSARNIQKKICYGESKVLQYFGNMWHNLALQDVFTEDMKMMNHTGLWDAEFVWYSLRATCQICHYGLEHSQGIHSFRPFRDSRKAGSLWGMMRGVEGERKSIHQSWLAKGLGLGLELLCWSFKGVQEEILSEEASTLQIGSVAFPPGQCISPQLHPCHRLFDQDGYQDTSSASL